MFVFDGTTKYITVSGVSTFTADELHKAAMTWSVLSANMKYLIPTSVSGKEPLGGGVYTDLIYVLENGWKLQPDGYAAGSQILVQGTLITSDSSIRTVEHLTGECPGWTFQVATYGTVSVTGSGVTAQDKIDIADEVMSRDVATDASVEEIVEDLLLSQ